MTSSPDRPRGAAEIHANPMQAFKTSAYSDEGYRRKQGGSYANHPGNTTPETTCKPRANCLKPKEIAF
jgi:hypothetical protein